MEPTVTFGMRLLALRAAVRQLLTGRHVYLSTACLAGEHDYCNAMTGPNGTKRPGQSKFSGARCICPVCHTRYAPDVEGAARGGD